MLTNKQAIEYIDSILSNYNNPIEVDKHDSSYRLCSVWLSKKDLEALKMAIKALEQEPIAKCTWIKYDYRTMCPKEHIDFDYWRILEDRMETLKYCPYCGKEIEVEE